MIFYHFVFRTYKGKHILIDPQTIEFLSKSFEGISIAKEFKLIRYKILADHVHCLVGFETRHRPDYVIRMLKGISSREFFQSFRTNRLIYRKLWGRGYFGEEIKEDRFNSIIEYINNQTDKTGVDKRYNRNREFHSQVPANIGGNS